MKRFFFCSILSLFCLCLPASFKGVTHGFKLAKIKTSIASFPGWDVPFLEETLTPILNQSFKYLNKGAQCYVFESEDQKYVIKFFRYDQNSLLKPRKPPSLLEGKIRSLFSAALIAYNQAREETALVYVHLNPTEGQLPVLKAKGPLGQKLNFKLDKCRFVVQRKADPFRSTLIQVYQSGDKERFQNLIQSFLSMLSSRISKGIGNKDPSLGKNFGFLEDRAIEIDFGNYTKLSLTKSQELHRFTNRFRYFLEQMAPEWVTYFDQEVKSCEAKLLS